VTYEWLPLADFAAWLKSSDAAPGGPVDALREEVADYVEANRPDLRPDELLGFDPPPRVVLGAKMLGARLWARRGSPQGVASFAEFGPAEILRYDPDIQRLLGLGRYAKPRAR